MTKPLTRYANIHSQHLEGAHMTFDELMEQLGKEWAVEVKEELSAGERKAVKEVLAEMRIYQDLPADIPYLFRPKRYCLIRTEEYERRVR